MVKKVYVSWEEVSEMVQILGDKINDSGLQIDYVSGIPRGGFIPAVLFSHKFDKPFRHHKQGLYTDNIIIIDDIADSGVTIQEWREEFDQAKFATLHYKEGSIEEPDFYAIKVPSDYPWIVYPWELKESETIQDYLKK